MDTQKLAETALALVAHNKGILAADESTGTCTKRFQAIGAESTDDSRRDYRQMLFETPGLEGWVSGVILYDETIRQTDSHGNGTLGELLTGRGIMPGIKVDTGAKPLANHPGEMITEGLDGLRERLAEYAGMGARFAKWRAVITIGPGADGEPIPSSACIEGNAHGLARYAALCQEAGLVPIVEPEVLMDGDHDINTCERVTERTLRAVFAALAEHDVHLPGILLKPSMVIAGKGCSKQADVQDVATRTVQLFRRTVPAAVPGIVFLSGGQSAELATAHLDAMNRSGPHPWKLSFSYGRALQQPSLDAWAGKAANVATAQSLLAERAKANSEAAAGTHKATVKATA